jgi:hypothetical protein
MSRIFISSVIIAVRYQGALVSRVELFKKLFILGWLRKSEVARDKERAEFNIFQDLFQSGNMEYIVLHLHRK